MKRPLKNLLWLIVLNACASSHMPVAAAHLRLAHHATQFARCNSNLQIESVKYLGKNNGKDSVQVVFNGLPPTVSSGGFPVNSPTGGLGNAAAPSCAMYGVPAGNPPNFQGGLPGTASSQQIFGGIGGATSQGYELAVTITRLFGHKDTGTAKSDKIFSGQITTVVQIPRGAAETDPVKFDVTINTTFGGVASRTLTAQGNDAPVLGNATQTFANSSFVPLPDNCFPSVSITGLGFTPGSGATPDAVTIDWTANLSPSNCFALSGISISVEVRRADNSIARGATQPNATSVTINLSGAPAAPVSFIVRVSAKASLFKQFQVNKKGEFS